tara:strand:- start:364 stop:1203 length:840 start_codon:yes stop_codon:yes gene_type:complete
MTTASHDNPLKIADLLENGGILRLDGEGSADWRQVTEASLAEYRAHHQAEKYPQATLDVMAMFEGFIAKWASIWGAETMIDLGCGIGSARPPYVRGLAATLKYIGLDPLDETPSREYPFICGRLEDLAAHTLDKKFDVALFVTSLDHFEDARNALALAGKITGGGHAVIWCGLHDSPLIAQNDLSIRIADLCRTNRTLLTRILAFTGLALFTWPRVAWALARRERDLAAGRPLDGFHFHYFTEARLRALLNEAGTVHELTHCPGTNSVFAAVTLSSETE